MKKEKREVFEISKSEWADYFNNTSRCGTGWDENDFIFSMEILTELQIDGKESRQVFARRKDGQAFRIIKDGDKYKWLNPYLEKDTIINTKKEDINYVR
jgi:hypothetical protein